MLLYYITDRKLFPDAPSAQREQLLARIAAAAHAGVDFIQLREKDLSTHELEDLGREAVAAIRSARAESGSPTRLLVNSRVDVAIACGADGVHLRSGREEISAANACDIFRKAGVGGPFVGVSCHTAEEVTTAASQGTDFAVFAPVFEKLDDDGTAIGGRGISALRDVCSPGTGGKPVLALGGVTLDNAVACLRVGAGGVAGIRLFQQGDVAATVARLRALVA